MRKFIKNFFIIGLAVGIFLGVIFVYISRDISLEYNVWLNAGSKDTYNKGDYIRFKYNKPDKYIQNRWLIKQVTCTAGDSIDLVEDNVTCNNKAIAKVQPMTKYGDKLEPLSFRGVIPDGYYFVQGSHERSYDSRYFGLIKGSEINKKVIPLRSLLIW